MWEKVDDHETTNHQLEPVRGGQDNLMAWTGTRSRFTLLVITWWRRCCFCLYCSHEQTDRHTNASNVFFNEAFDWEEEEEEPFSSFSRFFLFVFFIWVSARTVWTFYVLLLFCVFFPSSARRFFQILPILKHSEMTWNRRKVGVVHVVVKDNKPKGKNKKFLLFFARARAEKFFFFFFRR